MAHKEMVDYVKESLSLEDRLIQLAEESAELSQAASKLVRKMRGTNPTPRDASDCIQDVYDEVADVSTVLETLGIDSIWKVPSEDKLKRWCKRLKQGAEAVDIGQVL